MAKVAIMGYGTVGSGVYDIIKTNSDKLSRSANGESAVSYTHLIIKSTKS